MYECEIWSIKKPERLRIDAFELWCWRRLLRVPWTARRSSQSILKEIGPGCSFKRLMLKLKLQYFGHLMQELTHLKRPWCWERLRAGGEGDDRRWDGWMASLTQWTRVWADSRSWWWTRQLACCGSWGHKELHITERLNWTEPNWPCIPKSQLGVKEWTEKIFWSRIYLILGDWSAIEKELNGFQSFWLEKLRAKKL